MQSNSRAIKINKRNAIISALEFMTLIVCTIFSYVPATSIVAIIIFCFQIYRILNRHAIFFIKYVAILFSSLSLVIGCVAIEFTRVNLYEIQSYSKFIGSIPLLILSLWVLLQTIYAIDISDKSRLQNISLKINKNSTRTVVTLVSFLVLFAFAIQFLSIAPHPAFIVGLERAAYNAAYLTNPVINILYNYSILLVIVPILLIINDKGWRRVLGISCVILNSLNAIWMGNKFGSLLQLLEILLIVFSGSITSRLSNKKIKKYAMLSALAVIGLIIVAVIIKNFNSESVVTNYFSNRVASQSELWWKIFDLYDGKLHTENFPNEIKSFFTANDIISENVGADYGIYHVMYLAGSRPVIDSYIKSGYRYSQAGFPAMYYYFGTLGPIIYGFIFGFVSAKFTNALIKVLGRGGILEIFIYLRLLIFTYSCFNNFIFNFYFSTLTLAGYIYLIFINFIRHKKHSYIYRQL